MLLTSVIVYIASFFLIWAGAGLIFSSAEKFSHKLRLSSFAVSFFILGLLTSIPELAVGLTSVADHEPEIFVGDLIGGIAVIFLFIIPILAILGNGLKLNHDFDNKKILLALAVAIAPSVFILDKRVGGLEAILFIAAYLVLFFFIQKDKGILDPQKHLLHQHSYSLINVVKIIFGVLIVIGASNLIVNNTIYFAQEFNIPTFYISLILLSLGTNIPELSLAIESILSGSRDIAFGDYIGSAAANTLLFGVFTLMLPEDLVTTDDFMSTFLVLVAGLSAFYYFSHRNNFLSRKAGAVLLLIYFIFVASEWIS